MSKDKKNQKKLSSQHGFIIVKGASEHNLKNISLKIPKERIVVFTGVSGSGKSSLVFDTIYAEGQRRYLESLSTFAKQFIKQLPRPRAKKIEGLSPTLSIEQNLWNSNPRSTISTVTEINDYLQVLFSSAGKVQCPGCGQEVMKKTPAKITEEIFKHAIGTKMVIMASIKSLSKEECPKILRRVRREGFVRVRLNGVVKELNSLDISKEEADRIDVVIDRIIINDAVRSRIAEAVELALKFGNGVMTYCVVGEDGTYTDHTLSERYMCVHCWKVFEKFKPRMFSFNNPEGACKECKGLGFVDAIGKEIFFADPDRRAGTNIRRFLKPLGNRYAIPIYSQIKKHGGNLIRKISKNLSPDEATLLVRGDNAAFPGMSGIMISLLEKTKNKTVRSYLRSVITPATCPACNGYRLNKDSLSVFIGAHSIGDINAMTIENAFRFFRKLKKETAFPGVSLIEEIHKRLKLLNKLGVSYLTLERPLNSLSGGEMQRVRLATQLGTQLVGVTYILDEPTIGLHPADRNLLIKTIQDLCKLGNSILIIEHDEETIANSDYVFELGPEAGERGGEIVAEGTVEKIKKNKRSLTGGYLSGRIKKEKRKRFEHIDFNRSITITGATKYNLKGVDAVFPVGALTVIAGVSGAGKSTLIEEILGKGLKRILRGGSLMPQTFRKITGTSFIENVVMVKQKPPLKSSRSIPATYAGIFKKIRELFSKMSEARLRGFTAERFSFNVKGGRCEACCGRGVIVINMHFMPDVFAECQECHGTRYNEETLEIRYKGKNITEILAMTVNRAEMFFRNVYHISNSLKKMSKVGLGYLKLGQPANTLSAGEMQRVKLAASLIGKSQGKTLFIFDEPTTGLHFRDIEKFLRIVDELIRSGNTVIVIEHNMDVISNADYIIDMGPGGGEYGGRIVACGTPEDIARNRRSITGKYLAKYLS